MRCARPVLRFPNTTQPTRRWEAGRHLSRPLTTGQSDQSPPPPLGQGAGAQHLHLALTHNHCNKLHSTSNVVAPTPHTHTPLHHHPSGLPLGLAGLVSSHLRAGARRRWPEGTQQRATAAAEVSLSSEASSVVAVAGEQPCVPSSLGHRMDMAGMQCACRHSGATGVVPHPACKQTRGHSQSSKRASTEHGIRHALTPLGSARTATTCPIPLPHVMCAALCRRRRSRTRGSSQRRKRRQPAGLGDVCHGQHRNVPFGRARAYCNASADIGGGTPATAAAAQPQQVHCAAPGREQPGHGGGTGHRSAFRGRLGPVISHQPRAVQLPKLQVAQPQQHGARVGRGSGGASRQQRRAVCLAAISQQGMQPAGRMHGPSHVGWPHGGGSR